METAQLPETSLTNYQTTLRHITVLTSWEACSQSYDRRVLMALKRCVAMVDSLPRAYVGNCALSEVYVTYRVFRKLALLRFHKNIIKLTKGVYFVHGLVSAVEFELRTAWVPSDYGGSVVTIKFVILQKSNGSFPAGDDRSELVQPRRRPVTSRWQHILLAERRMAQSGDKTLSFTAVSYCIPNASTRFTYCGM
jgi:hypothetical protein